MHQPLASYQFDDFQAACGQRDWVIVTLGAQDDAREHFRLRTQQSVRDFIFNKGLEDLKFIGTDFWRNNPDSNTKIMVDDYSFRTGSKYGYLAFLFNKKTGKWIIKSFKPNWNVPTPVPFVLKGSGFPRLIFDDTTGE